MKAENTMSEIKCMACGRVLMDGLGTSDRRFAYLPIITNIAGIGRELPNGRVKLGETVVHIRETPTICASVECLQKVLDDPSWTKRSVDEANAELRQYSQRMAADDEYDAAMARLAKKEERYGYAMRALREIGSSWLPRPGWRSVVREFLEAHDDLCERKKGP